MLRPRRRLLRAVRGGPGARQSGQGLTLRSDHAAPTTRTEITRSSPSRGAGWQVTRQPPWARPKKRGTGTTTEKAQSWLREYEASAATWKDLSRSHQEIGEEITQLLGMSREQFCQVVLLPQGDFARFLRADAEARGKPLGRLFDTHRFAEVEKRLAERRGATRPKYARVTPRCSPTRTVCSRPPGTSSRCRRPLSRPVSPASPTPS